MESHLELIRTPLGVKRKSAYIANADHANHIGKKIELRQFGTPVEFEIDLAQAALGNGKIRRGRKQKYAGVELVVRTPPRAHLTYPERRQMENRVITGLGLISGQVGWHREVKKGIADMHLETANLDSFGRPLTARARGNLLFRFRALVDKIHDEINLQRQAQGRGHIPTMPEVRKKRRVERHEKLVQAIVSAGIDLTSKSVLEWLRQTQKLGKRLRLKGSPKDYVSVLFIPNQRARRVKISDLIKDALRKVNRIEKANELEPPPTEPNLKEREVHFNWKDAQTAPLVDATDKTGVSGRPSDNDDPLLQAVSILDHTHHGNVEKVKSILAAHPFAWRERGVSAVTPLIIAAQNNHGPLLKILSSIPDSITMEDLYGEDAITKVISLWDNSSHLEVLLERGKVPMGHRCGLSRRTYAHVAAQTGAVSCLKWLLERMPTLSTARDVFGQTPAEIAVLHHNGSLPKRNTARWLVEHHPETFFIPNPITGLSPHVHVQRLKLSDISDTLLRKHIAETKHAPGNRK